MLKVEMKINPLKTFQRDRKELQTHNTFLQTGKKKKMIQHSKKNKTEIHKRRTTAEADGNVFFGAEVRRYKHK